MKTKNTVISQINGRVGILTFNRPHVLNAFNRALISETNEIMDRFIKTIPFWQLLLMALAVAFPQVLI